MRRVYDPGTRRPRVNDFVERKPARIVVEHDALDGFDVLGRAHVPGEARGRPAFELGLRVGDGGGRDEGEELRPREFRMAPLVLGKGRPKGELHMLRIVTQRTSLSLRKQRPDGHEHEARHVNG